MKNTFYIILGLTTLISIPYIALGGLVVPLPGDGSGTVTSITAGTGLTGGAITIAGTIALDPAIVADNIIATSTTANSSFAKFVGIGTTTPIVSLQVASSTGTSTVAIGWASTTASRSQFCWWNGDNWTIEYYPPNSITKEVATSTSCN